MTHAIDNSLRMALARLSELQREPVSRLALQEAVGAAAAADTPHRQVQIIAEHLGTAPPRWLKTADAANVPALVCNNTTDWCLLVGTDGQGQWVLHVWDEPTQQWREEHRPDLEAAHIVRLKLLPPFSISKSPVFSLVVTEVCSRRRLLLEAALAGLIIGLLGLITSFYSMQIYDRVIPTEAMQTLWVLSLGTILALGLEWLAKLSRTGLYEALIDSVDQRMARSVYLRLLAVRLDQFPRSVGSLAAQIRGYESVRSFLTYATASLLIDLPFAVVFLVLIAFIGGWLALIPLLFLAAAAGLAFAARSKMDAIAKAGIAAGNFKTGLLVETVEGAETIKAGRGGWRMLGRWLKCTDDARDAEMQLRRIGEHFQHAIAGMQQLGYVLLVASGAWLVGRGETSLGGLIACSILAGRVLSPAAQMAGQIQQWSHVKAALEGLDALWRLDDDHSGHEPVLLDVISGQYRFEQIEVNYGATSALVIPKLHIRAGERIGVIGPVGAGKTTLLRLLSGMYKPQAGRILLDDIDLAHIGKPLLAEHIGYLQQEGRLFAGTLRDNLLMGMVDPGDSVLMEAARQTGLFDAVIAPHPKGLQQEIYEGGNGLSGGQRQLVNLTRVFLRQPHIWLLDEPTAAVDGNTEQKLLDLFSRCISPNDTLVLVTHKPEMLRLVNRLLVVADHQIVLDGPTAQVLARLQANTPVASVAPARKPSMEPAA